MLNIAIIDLGTNTFHLLLAFWKDGRYTITHRERSAVKIGLGGITKDIIQEDGIERAMLALQQFKKTIDSHGIQKVYAFGTSAFRNAKNGNEVADRIKRTLNITVDIISGEQEAEFIYKGVRSAVQLGDEPSLIMDIGGGSVEFIIGNNQKIFWKKSVEIGAQRLLEKYQKHDPISNDEIVQLDDHFKSSLQEVFEAIRKYNPSTLIGSSGTFDTLSEIYCIQQSIPYQEADSETPLTIASFYSTYDELVKKNRIERLQIPGMIEMRVDMIVTACCLIRFLLNKFEFKTIRVSTWSLKEGVLAHLTEAKK